MKFKERKLEMEHELTLIPHEERKLSASIKLHRLQADSNQRITEQELGGQLAKSEIELMGNAMDSDRSDVEQAMTITDMLWQVGAIRTLFRPFLMLCLWLVVTLHFPLVGSCHPILIKSGMLLYANYGISLS